MPVFSVFEAKMIQTWYLSIRTQYGKLTTVKSGDGTKDLTVRDKDVLQ